MAELSEENPVPAAPPVSPAGTLAALHPAGADAHRDRFVRHANWMSFLTILSRLFGLVRDKVWSTYLGLGWEFSAFWQGYQFPNLFRRIFGEGALTGVFVPIYTRVLHEKGRDAANRLVQATSTQLVLLLGGVTVVGEAILVPIAFSAAISEHNRLLAGMYAIMLPYCTMVCLVALLSAVASVHEKFTAQSLSPIILNILAPAAALGPVLYWGTRYPTADRVCWVAGAVVVAGVFQVLQMLPTMRACRVKLGVLFDVRHSGVGEVIKAMLPMIVGYSAVQFNTFMDQQIAWWLSPDGHEGRAFFQFLWWKLPVAMAEGAGAKLSAAQRLYLLPVGIFGVSMATAIFPLLSRAAADKDLKEVKRLLASGLRKTLFISIPASLGMMLIARSLITLIYSGKATRTDVWESDIDRATWAAVWFCAGIWAFEAQMVILRVYFALGDMRTPMRLACWMVALNFACNITLVWFLREGGLALSTTIAATVQCIVLLTILRQRYGRLGMSEVRRSVVKGLAATLVMGLAVYDVLWALRHVAIGHGETKTAKLLTALVHLPVIVVVGVAVYAGMAWMLGMPEIHEMPVIGRIMRRRKSPPVAGK